MKFRVSRYLIYCILLMLAMLVAAPAPVLGNEQSPVITPENAGQVYALATIAHGSINDAAWVRTPLGDELVVVGADGILIYDMDRLNEQPFHQVKDHIPMPVKVAVSPNGELIATGHDDGQIILWERLTFFSIKLEGHIDIITALAFSPDGKRLVSASQDGTVIVWDISAASSDGLIKRLFTMKGHVPYPLALAFSPDGKLLATAGGNPRELGMLPETIDTAANLGETYARIRAQDSYNLVRLWDMETGKLVRVLYGNDYAITDLKFDSEGKRVMSGAIDSRLVIWSVQSGRLLNTIKRDSSIGSIFAFAFSPDESYLILSAQSAIPGLWKYDFESREFTPIPTAIRRNVTAITKLFYSPDQSILAAVHANNVEFYDVDTFQRRADLPLHHFYAATFPFGSAHPAFSPDGKSLALYDYTTQEVAVWDTDQQREAFRLSGYHNYENENVYSLAFSLGGSELATGSYNGDIRIWNLQTKRQIAKLTGHTSIPALLTFSPDGRWLASATSDSSYRNYVVRLWSLDHAVGYELRTYNPESTFFYISALTFSSDGHILAVRDSTMTTHFYDVATQTEQSEAELESSDNKSQPDTFPTPFLRELYLADLGKKYRENGILKDGVMAGLIPKHITWSPSGYLSLADFGQTGDVTITQMETNTPFMVLKGHTGSVTQTSFSPDGRLVVTAGGADRGIEQDDTLRIWNTMTGEQLKEFDLSLSNLGISDKLVFSPDGRYFVTATYDGIVRLWGVFGN